MRAATTGRNTLRRFGRDENGNFAILTGAVISVLGLSLGFAMNLGQLYTVKSNLRQALDSAVTSTARDITIGKIEPKDARDRVIAFLSANADRETMGGEAIILDNLIIDQTAKTVEATGHVDAGLYFPLFASSDTQRVSSTSAAVYSDKSIEVVMMLDVTGSMGGQKIKDLRSAASNAIDAFPLRGLPGP